MNQEKVLNRRHIEIYFSLFIFLFMLLTGFGCASTNTLSSSPDQMYQNALEEKSKGNAKDAAHILEKIELNFPYWKNAAEATLLSARLYFEANQFTSSISMAERYIRLHPGKKGAQEAYYLISQSYYEKIGFPGRDTQNAEKALSSSNEYLRRYKNGPWSAKVRAQQGFIREVLAASEMIVGRQHMSTSNYIPAIGRFGEVITRYPTTSQTPEALARLVEIYVAMGLRKEAQKTAHMLAVNAPSSPWYSHVYELLKSKGMLLKLEEANHLTKPLPEKVNHFN